MRKNLIRFIKEKQSQIMFERDCLLALSKDRAPFVMRLYSTFQSPEYLFLVTEYLPGGDLFSYLPKDGFPEQTAKFYCAQLVLSIEYMHQVCDIIFRDIKPENILLGPLGYVRYVFYDMESSFSFLSHFLVLFFIYSVLKRMWSPPPPFV